MGSLRLLPSIIPELDLHGQQGLAIVLEVCSMSGV